MTEATLRALIVGFRSAKVRYLVVGGLAVIAHGYVRFTADVDLILAFDGDNIARALQVLKTLNFRPRAPVPIEQFADPVKRREWQETKGLRAFSLFSSSDPQTEVDLFINDPIGFDDAAERAISFHYADGLELPVCGIDDLVKLKRAANRPKDQVDLDHLKKLFPDRV